MPSAGQPGAAGWRQFKAVLRKNYLLQMRNSGR
jgi:hypothetical protein